MANRRNRRAKRNMNVLHSSSVDTIQLGAAVESRFLDVLGTWRRIHGTELVPPKELDSAMLAWRTMVSRHMKGDFRNTEQELLLVQEVAQWTVDKNCELRNQPLKKVLWPH